MSNFFEIYYQYVKDTEPPPNFHAWSAIGAISALLGKKCIIPQGDFTVDPQTYIILVGQPGLKKSTAMGIAKTLVKSVEGVRTASDSGSREGLMDEMTKNEIRPSRVGEKWLPYWQSAIFVDEIADLLGGDHLDASMVRFLTTIWGQKHYKEATRKSGQVDIHNPYLTVFGCCPTKWVNTKLSADVITDGLSRRTIFVLEDKLNTLNPWPVSSHAREQKLVVLKSIAARMHQVHGTFRLTEKALDLYCRTYYKIQTDLDKKPEKMQAYFSSKHVLILKLCMCLSAGVNSDKIVTSGMVLVACDFLAQSERNLATVYSGVGRNELKSHSDRVLEKIRSHGPAGTTKAEIVRSFYDDMNAAEINEVFEVLQVSEQIKPTIGVAQDAPRFVAKAAVELPAQRDLMQLARQLMPYSALSEGEIVSSEQEHRPDPELARLLTHREERQADLTQGVLLRGRRLPDERE